MASTPHVGHIDGVTPRLEVTVISRDVFVRREPWVSRDAMFHFVISPPFFDVERLNGMVLTYEAEQTKQFVSEEWKEECRQMVTEAERILREFGGSHPLNNEAE